jgi:hypothetical protein
MPRTPTSDRKLFLSACSVALSLVGATADAEASSRGERFVADSEKNLDDLIAKVPPLADIKKVVVDDCKTKTTRTDADAFCTCGAATTINLWRADDKMRDRLTRYIANPSPSAASEFVKYEGPELYSPVCTQALGNH